MKAGLTGILVLLLTIGTAFAQEDAVEGQWYDSDKVIAELEKKFESSREKLQELRPILAEKSDGLKAIVNESIDKGVVTLNTYAEKLDALSRDAEAHLQEVLTSEEMQQLQEYLASINKETLTAMRDAIVTNFVEVLELTEAQITEVKPVIEESVDELAEMVSRYSKEGIESMSEFKDRLNDWADDLKSTLENSLDREQRKKLEKESEKIKQNLEDEVYLI